MTQQTAPAAVRRSVTVAAPVERAFAVFTQQFDTWWPRGHHIGTAEMAVAVIEPHLDGRWYERGVDGSECDWGRVLAWEPPHRLALSWQIDAEWAYDPDPAHASRVEVRFTAEGAGTRVELVHSGFEAHGAGAEAVRSGVDSGGGWGGLLERYAAAA